MDNYDFKGKVTLVRIDLNVPVDDNGKIKDHLRFKEHSVTIRELVEKKAKIVIISHQGRPGEKDFLDLKQHARILSKHVKKPIKFIPDITGPKAIKAMTSMKQGEIIMLDNVRKDPDEMKEVSIEEHMASNLIQTLSYYTNIFILDAFSVAHRAHATVIGFANIIPCVAGRSMQNAVERLDVIKQHAVPPNIFILGGGKPEDCLTIMEHMLPKGEMDNALTCGAIGELFLMAQEYDLGKKTVEKHRDHGWLEYFDRVKTLYEKYGKKITTPVDLAVCVRGRRKEISLTEVPTQYEVLDIGTSTYNRYGKEIRNGGTVVFKGPAGVFEKKGFEEGTKALFKAVTETAGNSLVGGGHTIKAMTALRVKPEQFNYVCLGGGSLVYFLSGKEMPGLMILLGKH